MLCLILFFLVSFVGKSPAVGIYSLEVLVPFLQRQLKLIQYIIIYVYEYNIYIYMYNTIYIILYNYIYIYVL